tara:strand:- start:544 stop:1167 length:624 start_codon:yes stop_codon:yes gene_type:complete
MVENPKKYIHLVLLLDKDMDIITKSNENENKKEPEIYISNNKGPLPEGVADADFTVDNLQTKIQEIRPDSSTNADLPTTTTPTLLLHVYLANNLAVANYYVSSGTFDNLDKKYTLAPFIGAEMYGHIVGQSTAHYAFPPPSTPIQDPVAEAVEKDKKKREEDKTREAEDKTREAEAKTKPKVKTRGGMKLNKKTKKGTYKRQSNKTK